MTSFILPETGPSLKVPFPVHPCSPTLLFSEHLGHSGRYLSLYRCYWNSSTLATSCEELTHWKRLWCWEGLGAGGEGDDRGWDCWMASLTRWTWVSVNSGSWWWTGRPGVLRFMGSQRVGHDWETDLIWSHAFFTSSRDLNCLLPLHTLWA